MGNELKSGMDRFEKIRDYVQELIDKFNLNIGKPIIISSKNMRNPLCNHDEYHRQLDQMEKSKKSVADLLANSELLVSNLKKNDALKIRTSDTNGITKLTNSVKELYQNGQKFKTDYESYRNSYHEMKHQVMELEKNGCSINKDMKADIDTNDNELKSGMD